MLINVNVKVPDGEICKGCDFVWYSHPHDQNVCILFDAEMLMRRYKEFGLGTEIMKCNKCISSNKIIEEVIK